jgi:hypothetical protein
MCYAKGMRTSLLLCVLGLAAGLAGASPPPKEGPAPNAITGEGTAHVQGPGFTVEVTPSSASVPTNAEQTATITIKPTAGFHVNKDFPIELKVTPPDGVTVAKGEQENDDAARLDENEADFAVKYTARTAGAKQVSASLLFGVCTPTACHPKKTTISFAFDANTK